jgi:Asp-tRNA(Asn)/Glu-tRNA(Gln) amidotransferase A subunit family amidase
MMERALRSAQEEVARSMHGPFASVSFLPKDNMQVASGIPYRNGSRIWRA